MEAGVRFPLGALKNLIFLIFLFSCNQVYKSEYSQKLLESVSRGELSKTKDFINKGADINIKNNNGKTPLHIAVENEYEDIVKLLLEKNVDVNIKDNEGNTPLHKAVKNGNYFIIKELLKFGADKNIKNNEGKTPFDLAKELGDDEILKLFK
ncbi:MAG: ankyrin repeat domain-containing protein [candidate division WOR-3 bacterium]